MERHNSRSAVAGGRKPTASLAALKCALIVASIWLPVPESFAGSGEKNSSRIVPAVVSFEPQTADDLARVLDAVWAEAGHGRWVPNLAPSSLPAGFGDLDVGSQKRAFIRSLLPYLLEVNRRILLDRRSICAIFRRASEEGFFGHRDVRAMDQMADRYRLSSVSEWNPDEDPSGSLEAALLRIDIVPPSLALAQAALETGWGSAETARERNALFGQIAFVRGNGKAKAGRRRGSSLARFGQLADSVEAYVRNLNTFWAYERFRATRARSRKAKARFDSQQLVNDLVLYSERRELYVDDLRKLMRGNCLAEYDSALLKEFPIARLAQLLTLQGEVADLELLGLLSPDA